MKNFKFINFELFIITYKKYQHQKKIILTLEKIKPYRCFSGSVSTIKLAIRNNQRSIINPNHGH